MVPVAMEATTALEPRGSERNGSPPALAPDDGTPVRPRVRGPLELPPPARPTAGALAGLAAAAAFLSFALVAGAVALGIGDDDEGAAATATEARRAVALLSKPSTERVPLAGTERRALLAVGSASRGFLVLRDLEPAPEGKAYEAWVVAPADAPRPAALFSGSERLVVLSRPVPPGATVGVSLEGEVGSDVPSERFRFVARRPAG